MKDSIKSVVALTVICAVLAVILAVTNSITAPIIEENEKAEANKALLVVMPDGKDFEEVDVSSVELPVEITSAHRETSGGYVIQILTAGYGSDMAIMVGIDKDGAVTGATCLKSSETLGYEKTYGDSTVGRTAEDIDSLDTVAGATLTTTAYKDAVKYALETANILKGEAQ